MDKSEMIMTVEILILIQSKMVVELKFFADVLCQSVCELVFIYISDNLFLSNIFTVSYSRIKYLTNTWSLQCRCCYDG